MNNQLQQDSMIGMGVDQGTANCGYAIVELFEDDEVRRLASGVIETDSTTPTEQRFALLYQLLLSLVEKYQPAVIGCEKLFFNPFQSFARKNTGNGESKGRNKSASIVETNAVTGLLYLIGGQKEIPVQEFVPGTVKKYVAGSGKAEKEAVELAIKHLLPQSDKKTLSHESDAVAIGITAIKHHKQNRDSPKQKKPKKASKAKNKVAKTGSSKQTKKGVSVS